MYNLFSLLLLIYLGELESTVAELEEINHNLATLKVEKDAAKGAILPVLAVGNTHIPNDKIKDKQKDLQDMESTLKELLVSFLNILFRWFL
jgi:E3 ubiquitin-protein ligase BRE1